MTVILDSVLSRLSSYVLSLLRIVAALLFLEHGLAKLVGFPVATGMPAGFTLHWFAGIIEAVGGGLMIIGLFSRFAAFVMEGEVAFAYFLGHAPHSFYPLVNHGEGAILFCFIFLYVCAAGPGALSLDALMRGRPAASGVKPGGIGRASDLNGQIGV